MIATVSTDHHPMIMPMIMRRRIQECLAKGSGFIYLPWSAHEDSCRGGSGGVVVGRGGGGTVVVVGVFEDFLWIGSRNRAKL